MWLSNLFKTVKAYHHHESHGPHTHSPHAAPIESKKSGTREIKVVRQVLDVNAKMADQNRRFFNEKGIYVLNVMSSPGSGKTTTLEKTLVRIAEEIRSAVIVGDIKAQRLVIDDGAVFDGKCQMNGKTAEGATQADTATS